MLKLDYESFACKIHLSLRGRRNKQGKFDWSEACVDGGILCGITFCTSLGGLAAAGSLNIASLLVVGCATAGEFLLFLASKRGLVQRPC
jgi:hypothetical protein